MSEERELKFRLEASLDEVRRRVAEAGGVVTAPADSERNWVFDRAGELAAARRLLRLRRDAHGARLTYKGPPRFEGGAKIREEIEVEVGDEGTLRKLLERLGFAVSRRYEKVREEWRLGRSVVCLDHTPLGDFVEFEGDDAVAMARTCGFEPSAAERRSYLHLWMDHRAAHPEAPEDMVFPSP